MNQQTWDNLVDISWDDDLSNEEKDDIIKSITGYPSHYKIILYSELMQMKIRFKMVELKYVKSLEEISDEV